MATPDTLTTTQAIGAVYDWLGRPDKGVLLPSIVCTKYWAMLGKIQSIVNLADRSLYLHREEFAGAKNALEITLPEIANFGTELGLEVIDRRTLPESIIPIPLISDVRQKDQIVGLAGFLFRDTGDQNTLKLRFNEPLADNYLFGLWHEPGTFARPGKAEAPPIPMQANNYAIIETAFVCLPDIAKIYSPAVYRSYADVVAVQRLELGKIFQNWAQKDPGAGVKHRQAFNEARRGGLRYGGAPRIRGRGPIIGDV